MIHVLAMSDNVQMAIVGIFGALIAGITPAVIKILMSISQRLSRVEQNTNGNLSDKQNRIDTAESRLPGITLDHPAGTVIETRMSVNDPNTPDPPKVIENSTVVPVKTSPEKSP